MGDTVRGYTTLYGTLNSLEDGIAHMTLISDKTLAAVVPPELYGQLAQRLGTEIGVTGLATYRIDDLQIVGFAITELTPYSKVPLSEALASLAEIVSPYYDRIHDIDRYVRWMRGDESIDDSEFDYLFSND